MKFPVLWSGLGCYCEMLGNVSSYRAIYNPRVNKVFIHSNLHLTRCASTQFKAEQLEQLIKTKPNNNINFMLLIHTFVPHEAYSGK